jgi:hypothetical protein
MYISVAQSLIKSIAVGRDPPQDANGISDYARDPVYVVCASHDATVTVIDLRDREQQYEVTRSRSELQTSTVEKGRADEQCRPCLSLGRLNLDVQLGRIMTIHPSSMIPGDVSIPNHMGLLIIEDRSG